MRLLAFQGLRYTPRAGDPGPLAAPPYDQVDDAARDRFHAASPHQFVHLTRPVAPEPVDAHAADAPAGPAGADAYRHAAELHRRWLAEGIVTRDERPALYPYVVELATGGRRLGVMALVEYAPPTEIRPHERTLDKPFAERLALLEATRIDLEPALLLAEDGGRLDRLVAADVDGARPLVEHRDQDGHRHLLFRVDEPARIAAYQEAVASRPAAIADGHHRYKVGQRFAAEHHAAPGTAAGAKLAVVTSMSSPGLTIDPIHRALRQPVDPELLAAVRVSGVTAPAEAPPAADSVGSATAGSGAAGAPGAASGGVEGAGGASGFGDRAGGRGPGAALARAVAAAPQPALGLWVAGRAPEVWRLAAEGPSPSAPALTVEVFQDAVLPALGLGPEAATDGTLVYRSDPDALYAQVAAGELGTGFWLPPMQPAEFAAAVARGDLLPPKSTRFLPKAMSGLVWSDHDSAVG